MFSPVPHSPSGLWGVCLVLSVLKVSSRLQTFSPTCFVTHVSLTLGDSAAVICIRPGHSDPSGSSKPQISPRASEVSFTLGMFKSVYEFDCESWHLFIYLFIF